MEQAKKSLLLKVALILGALIIAGGAIGIYYWVRNFGANDDLKVVTVAVYTETDATQPYYTKQISTNTRFVSDLLVEARDVHGLVFEYSDTEWGMSLVSFFGVEGNWSPLGFWFYAISPDNVSDDSTGVSDTAVTDGFRYEFRLLDTSVMEW